MKKKKKKGKEEEGKRKNPWEDMEKDNLAAGGTRYLNHTEQRIELSFCPHENRDRVLYCKLLPDLRLGYKLTEIR